MKQILTIGFGQAGVNISQAVLQLYLHEHSLDEQNNTQDSTNDVFFQQNSSGSYTYRNLYLDSDPYTRDQIFAKKSHKFMKKNQFICAKRATGGLFSGGKIAAQRQLNEISLQEFQKMLESCDNPQGIIINTCLLGGAAGIFSSFIQKIAGENYLQKKTVISNAILPSKQYSNSIVQQYNYCLSFKALNDYSNLVITCDNQSLYHVSQIQGVQQPGFCEANKLLAKMQSCLTLPYRSLEPMPCDLQQIATNIVCYPRINLVYPSASFNSAYSPFLSQTTFQMTNNLFQQSNKFFDTRKLGSKIAVSLSYRGNFSPYEVRKALKQLKDTPVCNFVDWVPLGFKVGITNEFGLPFFKRKDSRYIQPSQRSCFSLTSSMQYNGVLGENNLQFDKLYPKRAFVHWFLQGSLEEGQFLQSRQNLAALQKDYEQWQQLQDYYEE